MLEPEAGKIFCNILAFGCVHGHSDLGRYWSRVHFICPWFLVGTNVERAAFHIFPARPVYIFLSISILEWFKFPVCCSQPALTSSRSAHHATCDDPDHENVQTLWIGVARLFTSASSAVWFLWPHELTAWKDIPALGKQNSQEMSGDVKEQFWQIAEHVFLQALPWRRTLAQNTAWTDWRLLH